MCGYVFWYIISVLMNNTVFKKCLPSLAFTLFFHQTAEDDNFVVWNMLSDKDGPSMRGEEEEEEDDYFMDEY